MVFGGAAPGGQLLLTSDVENFPGFPEPVAGFELMERMHRQCRRLGVEISNEEAAALNLDKRPFEVTSSNGKTCRAKILIMATGAKAQWIGLESEKRLMGKGVSGCATCDGFFFKGKEVCVVGGGDTALEDALFLSRFASKVTIIHRRNELRACAKLQEKAKSNPKIAFVWDSVVEEIIGTDSVSGVRIKNVKTSRTVQIPCQGIFVAIGHVPDTKILAGRIKLDENGYIATDKTSTSVPGVFAAGDVMDPHYRQAITAAASGCMAAIEAERFLEKSGG